MLNRYGTSHRTLDIRRGGAETADYRSQNLPPETRREVFDMDNLELEDPIATLRSLGALSPESMNAGPSSTQESRSTSSLASYDPINRGILTMHECERAIGMSVQHTA